MGSRWLAVASMVLLAGGCAPQREPAEKGEPPLRTTDDFGLPLVIVIEAPEVPPEILGPSPPIQEESASP